MGDTRQARRTAGSPDRDRRARTRRRALAGVLGVVAIVLIGFALRGPGGPAAATPAPKLATPLWSVRRVPQTIVYDVGTQRLQAGLEQTTQGLDACFAVAAPSGIVAASQADTPRIPASTQKLFTATAALDELGPEFRYETKAVAANSPKGGEVQHLWLVGAGDPGITTAEAAARLAAAPLTKGDQVTKLETLADAIVKAGVHSIPGGIDGDDSRYDTTRYLSVWPSSYRTDKEIGPLGALTVNDGFQGPDGSGAAAEEPAQNAAAQLARLLVARGVDVGPVSHSKAPKDPTTIATLQSPPLTDVLAGFLSSSDNLTGELLTREIAVHASKEGTTTNGLAVIADKLEALGLPTAGLHMVDGSGLSRDNRAPCSLELATLGLMSQPKFAWIRKGMSVAGEHGTLAKTGIGTPLQGKLVAKTGSLNGVAGLAGFVDVKLPLEFSLLLNGSFSEGTGSAKREQMAQVIAQYPNAPTAEALVPQPVTPGSS